MIAAVCASAGGGGVGAGAGAAEREPTIRRRARKGNFIGEILMAMGVIFGADIGLADF